MITLAGGVVEVCGVTGWGAGTSDEAVHVNGVSGLDDTARGATPQDRQKVTAWGQREIWLTAVLLESYIVTTDLTETNCQHF